MSYRLSCLDVVRLSTEATAARGSYLLSVADEIAELNRANGDPRYSWQALVTGDDVEIIRTVRKNPNLD